MCFRCRALVFVCCCGVVVVLVDGCGGEFGSICGVWGMVWFELGVSGLIAVLFGLCSISQSWGLVWG